MGCRYMSKPEEEGETVYSNFDHALDLTEEQVRTSGKYHQHAAWEFCGYIYYDEQTELFIEEVWRYNTLREQYEDKDLRALIDIVNDEWGRE